MGRVSGYRDFWQKTPSEFNSRALHQLWEVSKSGDCAGLKNQRTGIDTQTSHQLPESMAHVKRGCPLGVIPLEFKQ
jgi:hypothetical protein